MVRLFLIRHGEPEASWGGSSDDPGLSARGHDQAEAAAATLAAFGHLHILSSPMRRCRETAAPFERLTGAAAQIEPRVSEVVAPAGVTDRRAWLRETFPWDAGIARRQWGSVDPALTAWRDNVVAALLELKQDSAVFSHFIAINALTSVAMKSADTMVCTPGHASISEFTLRDGELHLVQLGDSMVRDDVR